MSIDRHDDIESFVQKRLTTQIEEIKNSKDLNTEERIKKLRWLESIVSRYYSKDDKAAFKQYVATLEIQSDFDDVSDGKFKVKVEDETGATYFYYGKGGLEFLDQKYLESLVSAVRDNQKYPYMRIVIKNLPLGVEHAKALAEEARKSYAKIVGSISCLSDEAERIINDAMKENAENFEVLKWWYLFKDVSFFDKEASFLESYRKGSYEYYQFREQSMEHYKAALTSDVFLTGGEVEKVIRRFSKYNNVTEEQFEEDFLGKALDGAKALVANLKDQTSEELLRSLIKFINNSFSNVDEFNDGVSEFITQNPNFFTDKQDFLEEIEDLLEEGSKLQQDLNNQEDFDINNDEELEHDSSNTKNSTYEDTDNSFTGEESVDPAGESTDFHNDFENV